jgi:two-component system response regulator WspF
MPPLLAIGASTGGPQALVEILKRMTRPLTYAVVIVQHVDPAFAPGLASWLSSETGLPVSAVDPGQTPRAGHVAVACTGDHLVLDVRGHFQYVAEPAGYAYRPSVDVLFESLRVAPLKPGVAVLLTGMGRDGAAGLRSLRQTGWHTIAQDEATSVIWGMPGAAVALDAADAVLPIQDIGAAVSRRLTRN